MRRIVGWFLGVALAACGEDAKPGDPCADAGACEDDQACVIEAAGEEGTCELLPAECPAYPTCDDACFVAFPPACGGAHECSSVGGRVTLTCL